MSKHLKISIITPLYNGLPYVRQCLESIDAQTMKDFEVIIVDDGSNDGSDEYVQQYAETHNNVTVLRQNRRYAGAARNKGMSHAQGDYILFLDADDYFEPDLLEGSLNRIMEADADICVFKARSLDNRTGMIKPMEQTCRLELCPDEPTFNRVTNPRNIFCFTTTAPWSKLYRKSFLETHGLRYQDTRSANDIYFVYLALALADRITVLDKELLVYRQHNKESLQGSQQKDPLAFYEALLATRQALIDRGIYAELSHAFTNNALEFCTYNLRTMKSDPVAHELVFNHLKTVAFEYLEIVGKPREFFYARAAKDFDEGQLIISKSYRQYRKALSMQESPLIRKAIRKAKSMKCRLLSAGREKRKQRRQ